MSLPYKRHDRYWKKAACSAAKFSKGGGARDSLHWLSASSTGCVRDREAHTRRRIHYWWSPRAGAHLRLPSRPPPCPHPIRPQTAACNVECIFSSSAAPTDYLSLPSHHKGTTLTSRTTLESSWEHIIGTEEWADLTLGGCRSMCLGSRLGRVGHTCL